MPLPAGAPPWAAELALAYESGAVGQFLLYGNVQDRLPTPGGLANLSGYLISTLLAAFDVIFIYDLGNGLRIEHGAEQVKDWQGAGGLTRLPRSPQAAVELVSGYLRYLANLRALQRGGDLDVACILLGADQVLPGGPGWGHEMAALASLVRDWATETPFVDLPFASLLVADNLNDLNAWIASNPRLARIEVPLPSPVAITAALERLQPHYPAAFAGAPATEQLAAGLAGVTIAALEGLVKRRAHEGRGLTESDIVEAKKELVENDSANLVELMESDRTLDDFHGQEPLKAWLRQDARLWRDGVLDALPMGYLVCGPVGTGKTFLVECLAGEVSVPVVKLKNFRDRWIGSSEGNLEKIFRLVHALGRCIVFVDEADQALGRRDPGSGDSGLSGRLYAMIAQEMSDRRNRGRLLWILATSRPDLVEVDLKRPGRVDVKVPLLPTTTTAESLSLLRALCERRGLLLSEPELHALEPLVPTLLTPGAAEAVAVKAYRFVKTEGLDPATSLRRCLDGYQAPVPQDVLQLQMRLAVREATDIAFVPEPLRRLAED